MYYGVKYTVQFSSVGTAQDYKFEILEKNYLGNFYSLDPARSPVRHSCEIDDPVTPIKGTKLSLSYVNDGPTPLSTFYAQDDQAYKGRLWWGNQLMFEGYLIQDDCTEVLDDVRHIVTLSFNDGLGLLRDIKLNLAYQPGFNPAQSITEEVFTFRTLMDIIKHCIYCTGLELKTILYEQLFESAQLNHKIFTEETSVNMETFLDSDGQWQDCYTVLEKILGWYGLTIFQAFGVWNIVRWHDLRYYNGTIPGYQFNAVMTLEGSVTLDQTFPFGAYDSTTQPNTFEYGAQNRILRPMKFVKNTFNYKRPQNFKNSDFTQLGNLIRQYTVGTGTSLQTFYEYEATFWTRLQPGEVFIRVIKNYLNVEVERYIVVKTTGTFSALTLACISSGIEVAQNDFVSVTFSIRCSDFPVGSFFGLKVYNTVPNITRWAKDDPLGWNSTGFWLVNALQDGKWNAVEINPNENIPLDGVLHLYLPSLMAPVNGETHIKDLRLTYNIRVNGLINMIGHTHTVTDTDIDHVIKNNEDNKIYIDDSPKNSILGTTFNAGQDIGLLHKRTNLWYREAFNTERKKVGEIVTFEREFWRRKPRTILEGTLNGIYYNGVHASPLSRFTYDQMPGLNFILGRWEIDYENNTLSGTMYEMYEDGEQDGDFVNSNYSFDYIYSTE